MRSINLLSRVDHTGAGRVGAYVGMELYKSRHPFAWFPEGDIKPIAPVFSDCIMAGLSSASQFDRNGVSLCVAAAGMMARQVGSLRVGMPLFVSEKFSQQEVHNLKSLDVAICSTEWHASAVRDVAPNVDTHVCHLGVDTRVYSPHQCPPDKPFIFGCVGLFSARKNQSMVVEAFGKAFSPEDDVALHMVSFTPNKDEDEEAASLASLALTACPMAAKISFYKNQWLQPQALANFYNMIDCYVSLSRGEWWDLAAWEAMACGANVLVGDCTAYTAIGGDCGLKVPVVGTTETGWPDYSIDDVVAMMRMAYINFKDVRNQKCIELAQSHTWTHTTANLVRALESYSG